MAAIQWPIVDGTGVVTRQRQPPLFQMPHMWQPNLHITNPYHSSHCDRAQAGWRKWGHDHPDMYAYRATATEPDWYCRRVHTVLDSANTEQMWPWEHTQKPTTKKTYGLPFTHSKPTPWQQGYQAQPHDIKGQVEVPRWGLYHPHHYTEPSRVEALPPIHADEKHL